MHTLLFSKCNGCVKDYVIRLPDTIATAWKAREVEKT